MSQRLHCDKCSGVAPGLFLGPDNQWLCAPCLPDEIWSQYPDWKETKEREIHAVALMRRRSEVATKNFHSEAEAKI
jgi:hypothetical protein